jgi:hypothetical protein
VYTRPGTWYLVRRTQLFFAKSTDFSYDMSLNVGCAADFIMEKFFSESPALEQASYDTEAELNAVLIRPIEKSMTPHEICKFGGRIRRLMEDIDGGQKSLLQSYPRSLKEGQGKLDNALYEDLVSEFNKDRKRSVMNQLAAKNQTCLVRLQVQQIDFLKLALLPSPARASNSWRGSRASIEEELLAARKIQLKVNNGILEDGDHGKLTKRNHNWHYCNRVVPNQTLIRIIDDQPIWITSEGCVQRCIDACAGFHMSTHCPREFRKTSNYKKRVHDCMNLGLDTRRLKSSSEEAGPAGKVSPLPVKKRKLQEGVNEQHHTSSLSFSRPRMRSDACYDAQSASIDSLELFKDSMDRSRKARASLDSQELFKDSIDRNKRLNAFVRSFVQTGA